jgi:opacity protein-like surface antigen
MKYKAFAMAVVLGCGVMGTQAQTHSSADKKRFFELSYGYSPAGDVNTKPFTVVSANDSTANAQYGTSQTYALNYGWRQPYGWPVDVSLWISQMQTPATGVNIASLGMSLPQSKRALANTYALAVDRDVWRNADWVLQVGGMLGQMDLIDADAKGTTWGLSAGVRYQPQTPWFASAKLRYATVPESKIKDYAATIGVLEVPSQNIPTLHLGWGWSY